MGSFHGFGLQSMHICTVRGGAQSAETIAAAVLRWPHWHSFENPFL
jgi:hypothetical protein